MKAEKIPGLRRITLHNLHFYFGLMAQVRGQIDAWTVAEFRRELPGAAHHLPGDAG